MLRIFSKIEREIIMQALKFVAQVSAKGKLKIPDTMTLPKGRVEIIVLSGGGNGKLRKQRRPLRQHPFVGMWADREDIADTITFAEDLRSSLERRHDRRR